MTKKNNDVLISGGGLTGLLAAIAIKSHNIGRSVKVIEQGTYRSLTKNQKPLILTPLVRQLLHKLPLYEEYNYYEGRCQVYSFINDEHGLDFKIPVSGIVAYGTFIQILLNIAKINDIEVVESIKTFDYNFAEKYIVIGAGNMDYNVLIIAEGDGKLPYNEDELKIESDINEYRFKINSSESYTPTLFRKLGGKAFCIGDFGGYKDRLIDINCGFGVISAIYAAECIAVGKDSFDYYAYMAAFEKGIKISNTLRCNKKGFEFIPNILMGGSYSDI